MAFIGNDTLHIKALGGLIYPDVLHYYPRAARSSELESFLRDRIDHVPACDDFRLQADRYQ